MFTTQIYPSNQAEHNSSFFYQTLVEIKTVHDEQKPSFSVRSWMQKSKTDFSSQ